MASTELAVKVDVQDDGHLLSQTKSSPLGRVAKLAGMLTLGAAVVFGGCYAALTLHSHNNGSSAPAGAGGLADSASAAYTAAEAAYNSQYNAAKQTTVTVGTPRINFYNGTAYDSFALPESDGAVHDAAPVVGWAKLVHKDAQYGPIRDDSTAEEFEEIIEGISDPTVLAALEALLPDGADVHTSGSEPAEPTPAERRGLFFTPQPTVPPGVIGSTDRRTEPTCAQVDSTPNLQVVVDLLSVAHCSGTLITPNVVLTAGHCLHGGGANGDWMLPNAVTPRACQVCTPSPPRALALALAAPAPHAKHPQPSRCASSALSCARPRVPQGNGQMNGRRTGYRVNSVWVHNSWRNSGQAGGWGNDVGLIWLERAGGRDAGDVNGFVSMAVDTRNTLTGTIFGYPGQAGNPAANQFHNLWGMSGSISARMDGSSATFETTAVDVSGGTSGSGVLNQIGSTWRAVGILVAGVTGPNRFNIMVRLTNAQLALIGSANPQVAGR